MTRLRNLYGTVGAAALGLAALCVPLAAQARPTAYAIANGGTTLVKFNTATPSNLITVGSFSGGASFLDAIDFRPFANQSGQLYGYLDATDTLYSVNTDTAVITAVASGSGASATNTSLLGMDFNPTIDRVRVVTDSGQNLVYNPNTNGAPTVATALAYGVGDPAPLNPLIIDNAYTNNALGIGLVGTQQYGIDYNNNSLVTIANNAGTLATVGSLGINADEYTGFDIFTSITGVNTGYALLNGSTDPALYTIDLATGGATLVGGVGSGGSSTPIYSLAIQSVAVPEASTLGMLLGGSLLSGIGIVARRRNRTTAG